MSNKESFRSYSFDVDELMSTCSMVTAPWSMQMHHASSVKFQKSDTKVDLPTVSVLLS